MCNLRSAPCPFCGGTELEPQTSTPDREGVPICMVCVDCGATGPWAYVDPGTSPQLQELRAIEEWRRRTKPKVAYR